MKQDRYPRRGFLKMAGKALAEARAQEKTFVIVWHGGEWMLFSFNVFRMCFLDVQKYIEIPAHHYVDRIVHQRGCDASGECSCRCETHERAKVNESSRHRKESDKRGKAEG